MTKIIKVSGCHECPKVSFETSFEYFCSIGGFGVENNIEDKTLPGNCPLEDDVNDEHRTRETEQV